MDFPCMCFSGFDSALGAAFFGAVHGNEVWLFDGETDFGYRFSVEMLYAASD